jgi:FkbM family methyltransferase
MSLHGLGVLNYKTDKQSGEDYFLRNELEIIDGGVVLDVGANIGDYCSFLRRANSTYNIYAFEPHPETYRRLVENTAKSDINVFNVGVGAVEGKFFLYDYANNDGSEHASLHKGVIEQIHKGQSVGHEVKVVSLDNFVTQYGLNKISLLKIDTEGHEFEVLRGATNLLEAGRIEMIHLEFNEMNVVSRVFFKDIWDILPNYDFYRMLPDGLVPIKNYSPVFCEIFAYQNIVAKLKDKKCIKS